MNLEALAQEIEEDAEELIGVAKGRAGQVLVVGCSSSEVLGNKIGTGGSMKVAKVLYTTLRKVCLLSIFSIFITSFLFIKSSPSLSQLYNIIIAHFY